MNAPALPPELRLLPTHLLDPSPTNPRKSFPEASLADLASSIRQVGVLSPLLVRPAFISGRFEIVAGERRWRAAAMAEASHVPVIVRELDDATVVKMQCIENLQREDITAREEAAAYRMLVDQYGYTPERIAEDTGKSRSYVFGRLKLTDLCHELLELLAGKDMQDEEHQLSASHLLIIARIPVPKLQVKAAREIAGLEQGRYWRRMAFRDAQDHVQQHYMLKLHEAPWFKKDPADLIDDAGTCGGCPKRSGNAPDLFPDVKGAHVCTHPGCFADKRRAWLRRTRAEAEEKGRTVITGKEAAQILRPYGGDPNWVRLDDKIPGDAEARTYRKLLKGSEVEISAAQDKDSGRLIDIAPRDQVVKAAKEQGVKVLPAAPKQGNGIERYERDQAKRDAQAKRAMHAHQAVFAAVRQRYQRDTTFGREDLALIAQTLTSECPSELWALWGWDGGATWGEAFHQWKADRLAELPAEDLARLLIDAALIDDAIEWYDDDRAGVLDTTAKRLGIDAEAIRKQALADLDAKEGVVIKPAKKTRKQAIAIEIPTGAGDA